MKKKIIMPVWVAIVAMLLVACGQTVQTTNNPDTCPLEDGVYVATFDTDSGMFHVNEAMDGKGELIVAEGKMTIHISLTSKNILNLYPGMAEDAEKDGAILLQPTVDSVTYSDGTSEEVNGFDVPVPYLDEEFDLALIGTKGKWYDHKVSVSNPVAKGNEEEITDTEDSEVSSDALAEDEVNVTLHGGSGKSTVESPAKLVTGDDGKSYVTIVWSSPNYDYMIVEGEKYLPVNEDGNSTFLIPIADTNGTMEVIADTVAMSKPHEIEYELEFSAK